MTLNLTVRPFFWRATKLFPEKKSSPEHATAHTGTRTSVRRTRALARRGMDALGVEPGKGRNFGWNHIVTSRRTTPSRSWGHNSTR